MGALPRAAVTRAKNVATMWEPIAARPARPVVTANAARRARPRAIPAASGLLVPNDRNLAAQTDLVPALHARDQWREPIPGDRNLSCGNHRVIRYGYGRPMAPHFGAWRCSA